MGWVCSVRGGFWGMTKPGHSCGGNPVQFAASRNFTQCRSAVLESPGFNPRALTAASGSRPHASTFSFGTIIAPIIALPSPDPVRPRSRPSGRANRPLMVQLSPVRPDHLPYLNIYHYCTAASAAQSRSNPVSGRCLPKTGIFQISAGDYRRFAPAAANLGAGDR